MALCLREYIRRARMEGVLLNNIHNVGVGAMPSRRRQRRVYLFCTLEQIAEDLMVL